MRKGKRMRSLVSVARQSGMEWTDDVVPTKAPPVKLRFTVGTASGSTSASASASGSGAGMGKKQTSFAIPDKKAKQHTGGLKFSALSRSAGG
jgi:hypothetical protein